jgi:CRP-like cAMP-binding protein
MEQGGDQRGSVFDALPHFKSSPTFGGLHYDMLQELHQCLEPVSIMAGEVLIEEGGPPGDAYIVVAGKLMASTLSTSVNRSPSVSPVRATSLARCLF